MQYHSQKPQFPLFVAFNLYQLEYNKSLFNGHQYLEHIERVLLDFFGATKKQLRLEYVEEIDEHPVLKFQVVQEVFLTKFCKIADFEYSMPWMIEYKTQSVGFYVTVYQKGRALISHTPDEFFQSNTYLVLMRQMMNILAVEEEKTVM